MENNKNLIEGKITVEGVEYSTLLTKKYQARKPYQEPDKTTVVSFISGTIREVFFKAGDKVQEGDVLLSLEAMKMINLIKASQTGVIEEILIKEGELVVKNQHLVKLG